MFFKKFLLYGLGFLILKVIFFYKFLNNCLVFFICKYIDICYCINFVVFYRDKV